MIDYIRNLPVYFWTSVLMMVIIAVFAIVSGHLISKMDVKAKPSKPIAAIISAVDGYNKMIKSYIGRTWRYVAPLTLTLAIYVLLSNISGIFAVDTPTKYTSITFSLSIASFIIVQTAGFVSQGFRYLKGLFQPFPLLFPLNLVSEITPILSMALRLFGNIASGSIFLFLIYKLAGWFSVFLAPPMHLIFDIGFGAIQALVLVLLTIVFASTKVSEDDFVEE
ncbi:MAG: F0F1 ATP synthase subunit A [Acholeplasmataceae bacterium]|nr:F0F1 ATP synthase subunit A [Acholeplasmataceae bacterium]